MSHKKNINVCNSIPQNGLVFTTPQKVCVSDNGTDTNYFIRTKIVYSDAGVVLSETNEFSTDGITGWTVTVPTGTLVLGGCKECCPEVLVGNICVNAETINVHYGIDPITGSVVFIKGLDGTDYDPQVYAIKGDAACPFATVTAEIYQTGANSIDNIDVYSFPDPAPNVTITASDCLRLTLQFKDPITGANVGAAKVYTTNVGTPFTAADVADWQTTFGIFGGTQTWAGYNWSLTGWSKNTPQGAFLLPNPLLAYDIEFSVQIAKNCETQIVSNISSVLALARETAIADNGTAFMTPIPYTSDVTPMYPIGGVRLISPISHPMVVYATQLSCSATDLNIVLGGTSPTGNFIYNDGNWSITQIEKKNGGIITGSYPMAGGTSMSLALLQTLLAIINDANVNTYNSTIGASFPVLELIPCVDGIQTTVALVDTLPNDTCRVVRIYNTNGLTVEIEFKLFKMR